MIYFEKKLLKFYERKAIVLRKKSCYNIGNKVIKKVGVIDMKINQKLTIEGKYK